MIDKVRKILGLPSRKTGNKLVLSVEKLETAWLCSRVADLRNIGVERKSSRNIEAAFTRVKSKTSRWDEGDVC